jgi:hypothetical protein
MSGSSQRLRIGIIGAGEGMQRLCIKGAITIDAMHNSDSNHSSAHTVPTFASLRDHCNL